MSLLIPYHAIADAVATLLHPQAEAVVHDLRSDTIAHIAGSFSRRSVGDPSLSDTDDLHPFTSDLIGPYAKTNWDGRASRSISVVIRGPRHKAIGLLCINIDVSAFEAARDLLSGFLRIPDDGQDARQLFPSDWREAVNAKAAEFAAACGASVAGLKPHEQAVLLAELDDHGYLAMRGAANHLARLFGCSRATIYNRLAEGRSIRTAA
ncbi:MAG: PAS domain-containing protein [Sphingomonadaceae bacterium]|nr:PAS domain-containing protein [Sphingomonadaceae bacterium]